MTNEVSKNLMCIVMRGSVEIWLEKDKCEKLMQLLEAGQISRFVRIDDQFINIADVVGIFTPQTIEERNKLKAGRWKCKHDIWHSKGEECYCWRK